MTVANVRVSFTDVTESRCPKDLVCVWAGDAAVSLEASGQTLVLHTNASAGPVSGELAGLTIALIAYLQRLGKDIKGEKTAENN